MNEPKKFLLIIHNGGSTI